MAPNLALISIPAYYLLSVAPHTYALSIATQGNLSQLDNRNPRSSTYRQKLRESLGDATYAKFERAESAHQNNMENLPLYVGAIFAGLIAEQATKGTIGKTYVSTGISTGVTRFIYGWFATRVLYNLAYITTEDNRFSYVRSAIYAVGIGFAFEQFWNAAQILA